MADDPKRPASIEGFSAGFRAAGAGAPPSAGGTQLSLGVLAPELEAVGADGLPEPRRPGRPAGSRNRSTEEWREHLLARYPSPLEGCLSIATRPLIELARDLGCTRLEAAQLQAKARADALPYLHQKQPQAVEIDAGDELPTIILVQPGQIRRGENGATIIDLDAEEIAENQVLSGPASAQSDDPQSDGPPQPVDPQGETDDATPD